LFRSIENQLSTGLFTDYFDEKLIKYSLLEDMKINNPNYFSFGRVRTIICEEGDYKDENIDLGLGYLDKIHEGDFIIVKGSNTFAYFGELMSTLSAKRKLSGTCILGKTRDSRFTQNIFPTWSKGYSPVDIKSRGRVSSVGSEFLYNNIVINEKKYVVADKDGVVIFDLSPSLIKDDIETMVSHEGNIKKLIEEGSTVKNILKNTSSF
jgi:regulator of RNase E activity RraA